MQASFQRLVALSHVSKTPDRQTYESTKWLSHVGTVLQSAGFIADLMENQNRW